MAASWLTTGIRCARAAPSTSPTTKAPAIEISETFSVTQRPCRNWSRLSQMKDHSKLAMTLIGGSEGGRRARPPSQSLPADRLRVRTRRVPKGVRRARHVLLEDRVEPARDRVLHDLPELIPLLHQLDAGIHPRPHVGLALADPDSPGNGEERGAKQLRVRVVRRRADKERVVGHEAGCTPALDGEPRR